MLDFSMDTILAHSCSHHRHISGTNCEHNFLSWCLFDLLYRRTDIFRDTGTQTLFHTVHLSRCWITVSRQSNNDQDETVGSANYWECHVCWSKPFLPSTSCEYPFHDVLPWLLVGRCSWLVDRQNMIVTNNYWCFLNEHMFFNLLTTMSVCAIFRKATFEYLHTLGSGTNKAPH